MDTADFLLLWFGGCALGAAIFGLMCERAPVMDWDATQGDHPLDPDAVTPRVTMTHGGVIQRATPAVPPKARGRAAVAILPRRLAIASSREIIAWCAPYIANLPHNDALVAETIAALWRLDPPQDIYVEDD